MGMTPPTYLKPGQMLTTEIEGVRNHHPALLMRS